MSMMLDRQADDLVADEYDNYRTDVTRTVSALLGVANIICTAREVDSYYNQAWHGLYSKLSEEPEIASLRGLLTEATHRRAVDEFRTAHPQRRTDVEVLEALGIDDPIAETPEQQKQLTEIAEGLRASMSQRELQAATLCVVYGTDAAERAGMTPERITAIREEISQELEPVLGDLDDAEACADQLTLVNQFALGMYEPRSDGYRSAVAHLKQCEGCRQHALGTRALTSVTVPSGQMLLAVTERLNLGGAVALAAGAPIAPSPIRAAAKSTADGRRVLVSAAAVVIVLFFGWTLLNGSSGSENSTAGTAAVSSSTASDKENAANAKQRREARARAKRRAKLRAERRRDARARSRARARARAAARRRSAAAQTNAAAPAAPQVQQQVPQSTPQPQQQAPAPQPQPKPSTDPSQEFDVP